jgi:hypothetical protein
MIDATPLSIATVNGSRSADRSAAAGASTTGKVMWESTVVRP